MERYWISEKQLNQLVKLQHQVARETLVKEIFRWQLIGIFETPESKKKFKQVMVSLLCETGKENGKMGDL